MNNMKKNQIKHLNNSGCKTMHRIRLKFKTRILHHCWIIIVKFHVD